MSVDRAVFAARVNALLRAMDWRQDDLADRLGVTRQTVSNWLTQTNGVSDRLAAKLYAVERQAIAEKPADPYADVHTIIENAVTEFRALMTRTAGEILATREVAPRKATRRKRR